MKNVFEFFVPLLIFMFLKVFIPSLILEAISNIFLAIVMIIKHIVSKMLNIINSSSVSSVF